MKKQNTTVQRTDIPPLSRRVFVSESLSTLSSMNQIHRRSNAKPVKFHTTRHTLLHLINPTKYEYNDLLTTNLCSQAFPHRLQHKQRVIVIDFFSHILSHRLKTRPNSYTHTTYTHSHSHSLTSSEIMGYDSPTFCFSAFPGAFFLGGMAFPHRHRVVLWSV